MTIVFAILLFSLLVVIHELGHFVAAKLSGVQVNEFSIFMGPAIVKWQRGETKYAIRCIPFGGYCAMEGEDNASDNPRAFAAAKWWKRLIILVAGAAMNFLAGLLLLGILYAPSEQIIVPQIVHMEDGCLLGGENGLQVGDTFLEVDGEAVYVYSDISLLLGLKQDEYHDLVVERDGQRVVLDNFRMQKAEFPNEDGTSSMRYGFSFDIAQADLGLKLKTAWNSALDYVRMVRLSLNMLFSGKASVSDVSGPVGIVQQMTTVADASESTMEAVMNLVSFGAMLAINLAVMNLLPFPALDGGRVVCLLLTTAVEAIIKRKINPKYEAYLHGAGMILLLGLMALITFKDIWGLF